MHVHGDVAMVMLDIQNWSLCIGKFKSGEKRRSAVPMLNKNVEKKLAKKNL